MREATAFAFPLMMSERQRIVDSCGQRYEMNRIYLVRDSMCKVRRKISISVIITLVRQLVRARVCQSIQGLKNSLIIFS